MTDANKLAKMLEDAVNIESGEDSGHDEDAFNLNRDSFVGQMRGTHGKSPLVPDVEKWVNRKKQTEEEKLGQVFAQAVYKEMSRPSVLESIFKRELLTNETPCDKPCRFLKECVIDSEISGIPKGVRQRCSHPVFDPAAASELLNACAAILDVTEKFCEELVKVHPDVIEHLTIERKIALAGHTSLLMTPRQNITKTIVEYFQELDRVRELLVTGVRSWQKTLEKSKSDTRFFTKEEKP